MTAGPPFALVGCLVAQLYGSYYNLAFTLAILTIAILSALAAPSWRRVLLSVVRVHWRATAAAGCLALALALPAAVHYLEAAGTVRPRSPGAALAVLPRLASYMFVHERSWCYGWMTSLDPIRSLPVRHEHAIGLGFITTGCLLWVVWRTRTRPAVQLAITVVAVLGLLVTMFPGRMRLYMILYHAFPPFQGVRAVSRVGMLLAIPAGIAVAWMVSHRGGGRRGRLVAALAVLACLEQGVTSRSVEVAIVEARADEIAARVDRTADAFLVVPRGPARRGRSWHQLDAMWAARRTGVPTLNGYSGNSPPGWDFGDLRLDRDDGLDDGPAAPRLMGRHHGPRPRPDPGAGRGCHSTPARSVIGVGRRRVFSRAEMPTRGAPPASLTLPGRWSRLCLPGGDVAKW